MIVNKVFHKISHCISACRSIESLITFDDLQHVQRPLQFFGPKTFVNFRTCPPNVIKVTEYVFITSLTNLRKFETRLLLSVIYLLSICEILSPFLYHCNRT